MPAIKAAANSFSCCSLADTSRARFLKPEMPSQSGVTYLIEAWPNFGQSKVSSELQATQRQYVHWRCTGMVNLAKAGITHSSGLLSSHGFLALGSVRGLLDRPSTGLLRRFTSNSTSSSLVSLWLTVNRGCGTWSPTAAYFPFGSSKRISISSCSRFWNRCKSCICIHLPGY